MVTPGGPDPERMIAEARAEALRIVTEAKKTVTAAMESLEQRRRDAEESAAEIIRRAERQAAELTRRAAAEAPRKQNDQAQAEDLKQRRAELTAALSRLTEQVERVIHVAGEVAERVQASPADDPARPSPAGTEGGIRPPMPPSMWASMVTNGGRQGYQPPTTEHAHPVAGDAAPEDPAATDADGTGGPTSPTVMSEDPSNRRAPWATRWFRPGH